MHNNKKIIIVANTSWYLYNYKYSIIKKLSDLGYKVFTIAPYDSYSNRLMDLNIKFIDLQVSRRKISILKDLYLILKLKKIYKKIKPDIVHHFTIKPVIYGSIANNKYGATINTIPGLGYSFANRNLLYFIVRLLYKFAIKSNHKIIFQNKENFDLFRSLGIVTKEQSAIIPGSGIEIDKFVNNNINKNNNTNNTIVFGLVSRLLWSKGIKEFIDASIKLYENNPNIKSIIVGSADPGNPDYIPEQWLKQKIEQYSFISWVKHTDDVISEFQKFDVFIYPSYYKEGVPRSILEAVSMELPVIASDIPGSRQIVKDGVNGYLIKRVSSNSLYEKMHCLATSDDRIDMGKKGRCKLIGKFDSETIDKKVINFYNNL